MSGLVCGGRVLSKAESTEMGREQGISDIYNAFDSVEYSIVF